MDEQDLEQEPKGEVQGQEQTGGEVQEPQGYDFSGLNETFKDKLGDTQINEETFFELLENRNKVSEFEKQLQEKDQSLQSAMEYKSKYESFLDSYDPEKLMPNKEALALSQLSESKKGVDLGLLSKIRQSDLSQLDPLDGLIMADKLTVGGNTPDHIRRAEILRDLGVEDGEDLTENDKYRIDRAFAKTSDTLREIKDFQPEGVNFDFEAERNARQEAAAKQSQELSTHNKEALKILLDNYKETKTKIDIGGNEVELKYTVDDKFKETFVDQALTELESSEFKITNENASQVAAQIDHAYYNQNRRAIVQDFVKQALSKQSEQFHNENHNDSPTNTTEATPNTSKEFTQTAMEALRGGLKKRK